MTPRERSLLILLLVAASALALGIDLYLGRLTRLDAEFIDLQKRALSSTRSSLASRDAGKASSWEGLKERFFAPGTLPEPLTLASRVQGDLKAVGIHVAESRVLESTKSAQWIQYRAEGDIESWFRFLRLLRDQDPRTLFRSLSLVKKEGFSYAIAFEVGHAVLP